MSLPDPTAIAALYQPIIKPVFFAYLDILGDPVRCNTSGADVTPGGTGNANLDGFTFLGVSGDFVDISPIEYVMGGSNSATATLSGIPGLDDDTIATLATKTNYQGRDAILWRVIRNASNAQQGGYHQFCAGKMTAIRHIGSVSGQTISVTIEGYAASMTRASNRTYMSQELYDAGDLSARAAIAIANGSYTDAIVPQSTVADAGLLGLHQW